MELNNLEIKIASKDMINKHIEELLMIDRSYFNSESWTENAFLSELPLKFEKSILLMKNDSVIGYAIVSKKAEGLHLHKLAISKDFVLQRLGEQLLTALIKSVGYKSLTLKVDVSNIGAVIFYLKLGFLFVEKNGNYYTMKKDGI